MRYRKAKFSRRETAQGSIVSGVGTALLLLCLFIGPVTVFGAMADSIENKAFSKQLAKRFSKEHVQSILLRIPEKCKIFGFDIGDYSGDGVDDLVFSARSDENTKNELSVYFFMNRNRDFDLVKYISKKYISEPIEIGFSIDQGICTVTQKYGEYHWRITGFQIEDMVFREVTNWDTQRIPQGSGFSSIGYETMMNLKTFWTSEVYYRAGDARQLLRSEFFRLPVLPSKLQVPNYFTTVVGDSTSHQILYGSSSWFGADDCSMFLSARYDSILLGMHVVLNDDTFISGDSLHNTDFLELCLDLSGKRKVEGSGKIRSTEADDLLYVLIRPGNGSSILPKMELSGPETGDVAAAIPKISFTFEQKNIGSYDLHFVFPMSLFNLSAKSMAGFAARYHDVDNPGNLEWVTDIGTSSTYDSEKSSTFGQLLFIRGDESFMDFDDLHLREILSRMERAGITR